MLISRIFTPGDQDTFARLSGDYNPIHIDALAARRYLFGRPVVHGVHALLWSLDAFLKQFASPRRIKSLKTSFHGPMIVNQTVELNWQPIKAGGARITVTGAGGKLLTADLVLMESSSPDVAIPALIPARGFPRVCDASDVKIAWGRLPLYLEPQLASAIFPTAAGILPTEQIAALLATTRLVGMESPGLHSIYTALELGESDRAGPAELAYEAIEYDERFSMVTMSVQSPGLIGNVMAAMRPVPRNQKTFDEIRSLVEPTEFAGERVLVIGGSRGLGEVAVKLCAAGGADVRFTYNRGADDAQKIVSEIAAGGTAIQCFSYNVEKESAELAARVGNWSPTWLCYFATPFIFSAVSGQFSTRLFRDFCDCYVDAFLNTFLAVKALGNDLKRVIHPSSSAVDELPLNMGEYAAAKSSAEMLCQFLEKSQKGIRFHCPRLPRLPTDQTASLLQADVLDPNAIVLSMLRDAR